MLCISDSINGLELKRPDISVLSYKESVQEINVNSGQVNDSIVDVVSDKPDEMKIFEEIEKVTENTSSVQNGVDATIVEKTEVSISNYQIEINKNIVNGSNENADEKMKVEIADKPENPIINGHYDELSDDSIDSSYFKELLNSKEKPINKVLSISDDEKDCPFVDTKVEKTSMKNVEISILNEEPSAKLEKLNSDQTNKKPTETTSENIDTNTGGNESAKESSELLVDQVHQDYEEIKATKSLENLDKVSVCNETAIKLPENFTEPQSNGESERQVQ